MRRPQKGVPMTRGTNIALEEHRSPKGSARRLTSHWYKDADGTLLGFDIGFLSVNVGFFQAFHNFLGVRDNFRQTYADVGVLPTPGFFYGLKPGEEITVEIESGKTMIVKFLTIGEAHPDGTRTLFFELNGQPREVTIRDRSLRVVERAHPKVNPEDPGQVGAPTAGLVSSVAVQVNHTIERGAKLLTLEAMKMQSNIYAPIAGRVVNLHVTPGQHVEAKDLLVVISP